MNSLELLRCCKISIKKLPHNYSSRMLIKQTHVFIVFRTPYFYNSDILNILYILLKNLIVFLVVLIFVNLQFINRKIVM